MILRGNKILVLGAVLITLSQCKKDPPTNIISDPALSEPTPYVFDIPNGFPSITNVPSDNPTTVEGVALGKKLFYDPILSGDNTQSCSSCHATAFGFSDNNKQFSEGIDGDLGDRNSPTIINALWGTSFFWDGRSSTLEDQALGPVPNPIEMHLPWEDAVAKLTAHAEYPELFEKAFNTRNITKEMTAKAIAQFERTFISANSRYDKYLAGNGTITPSEQRGYNLFFSERAECFHCHGTKLFTDNDFHNNGLDATFSDKGLGKVTENPNDNGKFKTPTLRNIGTSAPYMHDGRFATLEEVVEFYSTGVKFPSTIDPLMKNANLSTQEKADLVAFLKTLTDAEFITSALLSNY